VLPEGTGVLLRVIKHPIVRVLRVYMIEGFLCAFLWMTSLNSAEYLMNWDVVTLNSIPDSILESQEQSHACDVCFVGHGSDRLKCVHLLISRFALILDGKPLIRAREYRFQGSIFQEKFNK
jgi:hypothetical protein